MVGYIDTSELDSEVSSEMLIHTGTPAPIDSFALGFDRRAGRLLRPSWIARTAARVRAPTLDRALMRGADLAGSSWLAARAAQLTDEHARQQIADSLDRVLHVPHDRRGRGRVTPSRRAVLTNEPELRELTALLRGSTPIYARGVAMLHALLTDGTGPVYTDPDGALLETRLQEAREAISQP